MNNTAICTVSSANYFPFAKTMLQSVGRVHPECDLFFLLVDQHMNAISAETGFLTIDLEELKIPDQLQMAFVYDIVEMNTAVKPFLFAHLFQKGYTKVLFIDPDVVFYNRLDAALNALDTHAIVLTPHSLSPAPPATSYTDKVQWEQNMTVSGIFNLGFIGMSNRQSTDEFLLWWQNRCRYLCFLEPIAGLFVDQKWAELTIVFWKDVYILRDPGYNVSIWNLHERRIANRMVNNRHKLIFYHFSSFNIYENSFLSKHDRSITFIQHPELQSLFAEYQASVERNGYAQFRSIPYAYACFKDGKSIDILERRLYANTETHKWDPFTYTKRDFYRNLKKYLRTSSTKNKGVLISLGGFFASWLLRIIGAKNYRTIMLMGGKTIQLRAHTFLIR